MAHRRIDVHQHVVPPAWSAWLRSKGIRDAGGCDLPSPSVDNALRVMEERDIAPSGSPAALPSLLAFAKPGHVLFGSDWPYAPVIAVQYFTGQFDACGALDDDGHVAVNRRNAERLFPESSSST